MARKGAQKGEVAAPEADSTPAEDVSKEAPANEVRRFVPPPPVNRVDVARPQAKGPEDWRRHLTPREEPGRPGLPPRGPALRGPMVTAVPPDASEPEHRPFPRAEFGTRVECWMDDGQGGRRFSASLKSLNVSISGAFLESTFFLPVGTQFNVRFALEEGAEPVQARAEIVREERGTGPNGRTGIGIRFVEFTGQTEVSLARLFLGMKLRAFAEEYLQSRRARALPNELERVVDVLAAWELLKATTPGDPWRGE